MRKDIKFRNLAKQIVDSSQFDLFMVIVTLLNALTMGLEIGYALREPYITLFRLLSEIYTGIYTFEFILKLYVESYKYFKSLWNIYDFFILIAVYSYLTIHYARYNTSSQKSFVTVARVIRSFRMFRILRTVSFLKELKIIVLTLLSTVANSVLNVVLLILMIFFIFSVIANSFFQEKESWKSLSSAMWTLFRFICVDEWPLIQAEIDDIKASKIFTILFVFIGNFIFTNIFVGLIIMNISDAQQEYKRSKIEEKKNLIKSKKEKILRKQIEELNQVIKRDKVNDFNVDQFKELVIKYRDSIKHDELVGTVETSSNLSWINTYLSALKCFDNCMIPLKNAHFEMSLVLASIIEDRLKNLSKKKQN